MIITDLEAVTIDAFAITSVSSPTGASRNSGSKPAVARAYVVRVSVMTRPRRHRPHP